MITNTITTNILAPATVAATAVTDIVTSRKRR